MGIIQKKGIPFGFYVCSMAFTLERFSYYSAKWLITVFIAASIVKGGLGLSDKEGAQASANLVAFTYLAPLFGAYISDHWVGARYLVPVGMVLMGAGYMIGWQASNIGMVNLMILLVSIGTGLFKPQTNAITGRLFSDKTELDGAFSIQYSFVNLGSFIGTTSIGVIADKEGFRFCFLICGIILFINAIWFVYGWRHLGEAGKKPFKIDEHENVKEKKEEKEKRPLTLIEKKRVGAIILVSFFSILFWMFWYLAYLPVYFHWAGENPAADWVIRGFKIPSSWFDSLNGLACVVFGPILGYIWTKRAKSSKGDWNMFQKTAFGMLLLGIAFVIFALADVLRGESQASLMWIIAFGLILTLGEMVFSPLGNSFITKFSPPRILSNMMAIWTLSIFFVGKFYDNLYTFTKKFPFAQTYFVIAAITIVSGIILWSISGKLNSLVIEEEKIAT